MSVQESHSPPVFISYSSRDADRVAPIAKLLEKNGIALWRDREKILGGQLYAEQITHAIAHSKVVLLMCSAASLESDNVMKEVFLTWDHFHRNIIPVWLDKPFAIPRRLQYPLAGCHWIETQGHKPSEYEAELIAALRSFDLASEAPVLLSSALPQKLRLRKGDRPIPGVDWELVELLGKGGYGEVWKAINPELPAQKPVALKFCLNLDGRSRDLLRHEAEMVLRAQTSVGEAGIVPLQHAYLTCDPPCLQYPFVAGGTLTEIIEENRSAANPLSPTQVMTIVHRIATIVGGFHRANPALAHCDLKPSNILVTRNGKRLNLRVNDFGIGRFAAAESVKADSKSRAVETNMSAALTGAHTPLYASPQLIRGEPPAVADDVYALGVIWYQLLVGQPTVGAPSGRKWYEQLRERKMATEAIDLLAACLETEAAHRPKDGAALAQALSDCLAARSPSSGEIVLLESQMNLNVQVAAPPTVKPIRSKTVKRDSPKAPPRARRAEAEPSPGRGPWRLLVLFALALMFAETGLWFVATGLVEVESYGSWVSGGEWRYAICFVPFVVIVYLLSWIRASQHTRPGSHILRAPRGRTIRWTAHFFGSLTVFHVMGGFFVAAVMRLVQDGEKYERLVEPAAAVAVAGVMGFAALLRKLLAREPAEGEEARTGNPILGVIACLGILVAFAVLVGVGSYAYYRMASPAAMPDLATGAGTAGAAGMILGGITFLAVLYYALQGMDGQLNYLLHAWMGVIGAAIAISLPVDWWKVSRFPFPIPTEVVRPGETLKTPARPMVDVPERATTYDGHLSAVANPDGGVSLLGPNGTAVRNIYGFVTEIKAITFSLDEKFLIVEDRQGLRKVWDISRHHTEKTVPTYYSK